MTTHTHRFAVVAASCATLLAHALPRDEHGWTVFTPSPDTRIIYVSSSGSNATAQWYAPGSGVIGDDPFNPTGTIAAYATVSNALTVARSGYPDWVLLKRGDVFYDRLAKRNGRGFDERFLFGAYGGATNRPVLKVGTSSALSSIEGIEYTALVSLDMYAHTRDPGSPEYAGPAGGVLVSINNGHYRGTNIVAFLIEDCLFRFGQNNFNIQNTYTCNDVVVRRNVIVDAYSTNSHSQGIFASDAPMLLEENIFDHNGWLIQGVGDNAQGLGGATMFNHNTYFSSCNNVRFYGNIFLRASSIGNKWTANKGVHSSTNLAMVDNLYVDGEIGISIGGNTMGPLRFADVAILSNVFTDIGLSRPTGRTLGWGINPIEWDNGVIEDNLLLHQTNAAVNNVYGISFSGEASRNMALRRNLMHGLRGATGIIVTDSTTNETILFESNRVQFPGLDARVARTYSPLYATTFRDSVYYTDRATTAWFAVTGSDRSFSYWQQTVSEPSAVAHKLTYPAPERSIDTYMLSLGETGTHAAFIAAVRAQSKMNWRTELTAPEINEYFRAGFRTLSVTTTGLPVAVAGQAYTAALDAVNASGTVQWVLYHGSLPEGLNVQSNGVINGTPAGWSTNSFTVLAQDAVNVDPKTLQIVVVPEPAWWVSWAAPWLLRRESRGRGASHDCK